MNRSPISIFWAVVVALLAFVWLSHLIPPFPINDDGIRDQLLARDCSDLGRCHMIGANASLQGFHHGPVWLHVVVLVRLLGGDLAETLQVVIALMALSAATVFVVVWRWLRPSIALPATVLYLALLRTDPSPNQLINPSITALPDALTAAAILCYGLSTQRRFLWIAAFVLGAGISVHLAAAVLVLPLVGTAALVRTRGWRDAVTALVLVATTYGVTSTAALRANVMALAQPERVLLGAVAGVLFLLLCQRGGRMFRRLGWDGRAWLIGILETVPFALAIMWLIREHHFVSRMYLHPIVAPAAVMMAAVCVLPFELGARWRASLRWMPTTAALTLAAVGLMLDLINWRPLAAVTTAATAWRASDASAIAAQVTQQGWQYEDLLFRLQSRHCRDLLTGLSFMTPAPTRQVNEHTSRQLQIVRMRVDAMPRLQGAHVVVALDAPSIAVLREIDSWLRPEGIRACRRAAGAPEPECMPAHRRIIDAVGLERFLFITRSFPEIHSLGVARPYTATYEIPLEVAAAEERELAMIDEGSPECGWRIISVEGVTVDAALPARHVRLRAAAGVRGRMVIERSYASTSCGGGDADLRYLPCMFEAPVGDPLLAAEIQG